MSEWSNKEYVNWIYKTLLHRDADESGLDHFSNRLESGEDLKNIVESILAGDEYKAKMRAEEVDPLQISQRQRRRLTIVDVGARLLATEDHIYAPLTKGTLDWRAIGFEPQKHRIEERAAAEPDPRLVLIEAFIGDGKEALFHTVNDDGSSSLLDLNLKFNADFDDIGDMRVVSTDVVKTSTLDDALAGEPHIDFLKFDIQGFEGRALSGAKDVLQKTNVVHCEVFFGPMYHETAFFRDIDHILSEAGFEFIDFSHLNRYEYTSVPFKTAKRERLIWGDAVFFRKDVNNADDRIAQALIASMIYKKHGLAQTLLRLGSVAVNA